MTHLRRFLVLALVLLCAAGIVLNFGGCSKVLPLEPELTQEEDAVDFPTELSKRGGHKQKFPQYAEKTFKFDKKKGYYRGGKLNTTNGSKFKIKKGDLDPSLVEVEGWKYGDPVTITMQVEKEDDKLIFTFGPSGCRFKPSAELTLSWNGLNAKKHEVKTINLLDANDDVIEADEVDTRGQMFLMWIPHFSRYAISKGE